MVANLSPCSFLGTVIHGACAGIGRLVGVSPVVIEQAGLKSSCVAFFAIVDLLAVLPYYIEVALQQDTVRAVQTNEVVRLLFLPRQTILFRFSILRTLRLLRVFRAFKYQNQMLLYVRSGRCLPNY